LVFTSDTRLYPKAKTLSDLQISSDDNRRGEGARRGREPIWKSYPQEFQRPDVLVVHLGSISREEFSFGANPEGKRSDHLGLSGVIEVISHLKPKVAVLGEFGEELREIKTDLVAGIAKYFGHFSPLTFVVGGETYTIYDLYRQQMLCHETGEFESCDKLQPIEEHERGDSARPTRTYLFRKDLQDFKSPSDKVGRFHTRLDERRLPYFLKNTPTTTA
jgi:hypothetical protein